MSSKSVDNAGSFSHIEFSYNDTQFKFDEPALNQKQVADPAAASKLQRTRSVTSSLDTLASSNVRRQTDRRSVDQSFCQFEFDDAWAKSEEISNEAGGSSNVSVDHSPKSQKSSASKTKNIGNEFFSDDEEKTIEK